MMIFGEKEKERIRERHKLEQNEGAQEAVGCLAGSRPTLRKREGEEGGGEAVYYLE
jgi:hypothetical protein